MSEVTSVNTKTGAVVLKAADVEAIPESEAGQPGGVATLNGSGELPEAQLPGSVASKSEVSAEEARAKAAEKTAREEAEGNSDPKGAATTAKGEAEAAATGKAKAAEEAATAAATSKVKAEEEARKVEVKTETERAEAAEALKIPLAQKGKASGVAELNGEGKLPEGELPSSVVSGSGIYVANVWNYGPEGKRAYALLAGGVGGLRDGSGRALSTVYSTLAAAQAKYSFVTSLTQTVDWAANTAAIHAAAEAGGGTVVTPASSHPYIINSPITQKYNTNYDDLGLAGGFESNGGEVATFKLAKEANCHMIEGDPEAPEGTIAAGFRNQNSAWRVVLDGNHFEQTTPVDNFHLVSLASCTFREGTFSRNASGACYHLEKCLELTGKIPAKNGGTHVYFFNDLTDSILDVNGFGSTQGSVLLHEASGGRTCQIRGFVGNCNPPNGTLKETITAGQTAGIVLINNGKSGMPTWGGTILIGTEQIAYTGYTQKSKEVTLTGVTRGANSTAAAEHLAEVNWHEYMKYQDGVTYLGTNGRLNRFDLRSDQNWGHSINIPETGVYDSTFIVQCTQAGFENPEAQDSIVCNSAGITLLGNATFCDQVEAFPVTANTEIGTTVINMTGAKAKGFINGARVVITALTGGVKGLATGKLYFVVGAKGESEFELSLTEGGAAVKVEGHTLEASTKMLVSSERLALQVGASAKGCTLLLGKTAGGTTGFAWPYPSVGNPDGSAISSANTSNTILDAQNERLFVGAVQIGEGTDLLPGINLSVAANARLEYNGEAGHVGAQISGANLLISTAGDGLRVKEGSNCKQGVSGSMAAGKVTVSNTAITASSRLMLTRQAGGTHPGAVYESERVAGEKFVITSTNPEDTGAVAYQIFEPA